MPKKPTETTTVSFQPQGRWMWKEESQTLEFISSNPAEEAVKRKQIQTNVSFRELQLRADWLAAVCSPNHGGRQSLKKSLNPAHLDSYRRSVKKKQQDHVTLEDVKEAAVALLQDNYLLPIPFCFLDVLKSKELDGVLEALLLYLSCFFEHRSLEDKPASSAVIDIFSEHQRTVESLAKKRISQRKLAVRYFSLMMVLLEDQRPQNKGRMSSSRAEWLLHAILYSFFCLVCWVTMSRRRLEEIQEELGRLFYSDAFNGAMKNRMDEDNNDNNEEATRTRASRHKTSPRPSSLGSVSNRRSPLMVSLLPSPKERSPHLFSGTRSSSQNRRVDAEAQMEQQLDLQLDQQLDLQLDLQLEAGSFGILGKPLDELNRSSLLDQNNLRGDEDDEDEDDEDEDDEDEDDDKNNPPRPPGVQLHSDDGSFRGSSGKDSESSVEQKHQTLQLL